MTAMDRKRELRPPWQRAAKLILSKADVMTVSRALRLTLFYDAKLGLHRLAVGSSPYQGQLRARECQACWPHSVAFSAGGDGGGGLFDQSKCGQVAAIIAAADAVSMVRLSVRKGTIVVLRVDGVDKK